GFALRYDIPSECARLLHESSIDVGLIPSIEYFRGAPYRIVPDLAIASRGAVASVAIYTTKPMDDVQSIALDTSSRTSVALVRVLCARLWRIQPMFESRGPDLQDMLAHADAALIIGDNALFSIEFQAASPDPQSGSPQPSAHRPIVKIDLGVAWFDLTGLPFVYAFWAGRAGALTARDVTALQRARDEGVCRPDELARQYLVGSPERQALGAAYLRENIKYYLRDDERAGLETFYRYAAEAGVIGAPGS